MKLSSRCSPRARALTVHGGTLTFRRRNCTNESTSSSTAARLSTTGSPPPLPPPASPRPPPSPPPASGPAPPAPTLIPTTPPFSLPIRLSSFPLEGIVSSRVSEVVPLSGGAEGGGGVGAGVGAAQIANAAIVLHPSIRPRVLLLLVPPGRTRQGVPVNIARSDGGMMNGCGASGGIGEIGGYV